MTTTRLVRTRALAGALYIGTLGLVAVGADADPIPLQVRTTDPELAVAELSIATPPPAPTPVGVCVVTTRWRQSPLDQGPPAVTAPIPLPIAGCAGLPLT